VTLSLTPTTVPTPTPARLGRPRATYRVALGLAVVALVVLTACTTIRGLIDTENALDRAGFSDVDVGFDSAEGFDQVQITVRPESTAGGAEAQARQAAKVVWTTFPLRFDLLRVELLDPFEGSVTTYTYGEMAELTETFGARDPKLDEKALGDDLVRTGLGIAVALAIGGVLFLAAVVIAIVMGVRTSRRRKAMTPPPWPPVVGPDRHL